MIGAMIKTNQSLVRKNLKKANHHLLDRAIGSSRSSRSQKQRDSFCFFARKKADLLGFKIILQWFYWWLFFLYIGHLPKCGSLFVSVQTLQQVGVFFACVSDIRV